MSIVFDRPTESPASRDAQRILRIADNIQNFEHGKTLPLNGAQTRRCAACIGGHGTEPYEQNTQQSPGLGLRRRPQPSQS